MAMFIKGRKGYPLYEETESIEWHVGQQVVLPEGCKVTTFQCDGDELELIEQAMHASRTIKPLIHDCDDYCSHKQE